MASRLDVDGLQHSVHARCEKCGFELDVADRSASKLGALDLLAMALTGLALFALVAVASSLEQFEKMAADVGTRLPALTQLTMKYQLPLPFLLVSGVVSGFGAWRKAKGLRGGRALLWGGCALGLLGAAICVWGLYGPMFEMVGQVSDSD
jgi:hypothetical protein